METLKTTNFELYDIVVAGDEEEKASLKTVELEKVLALSIENSVISINNWILLCLAFLVNFHL
jgi:hypothetical protein